MAYVVMASRRIDIGTRAKMPSIVMASTMAYIVTTYIVMALCSFDLYSYGLYDGLHSYDVYSHGPMYV